MARRKRAEGTRAPNGASVDLLRERRIWHGRVTVGLKDNGQPDRRHVKRKTKATLSAQFAARTRTRRRKGPQGRSGVDSRQWLHHWLENVVAPPVITENAFIAYEVAARVHLVPGIGAHKLNKLEPEHLERLYRKMTTAGAKPGRVHQVHRTIRAALNEAMRRRHITENPAILARAPKVEEEEVEPYTVAQIKSLLEAAQQRRNRARWAIALALGLRQGEALGLQWSDIDLDDGTLIVRRSRLRPKWSTDAPSRAAASSAVTARNGSRYARKLPVRSPRLESAASVCPTSWWRCSSNTRQSRSSERMTAARALAGNGLRVHHTDRRTTQPAHRLHRVEATAGTGRGAGTPIARRPPHGRHGTAAVADPGPNGDGDHGMVQHRHGRAVPTHHCGHPTRRSDASWRAALGAHRGERHRPGAVTREAGILFLGAVMWRQSGRAR